MRLNFWVPENTSNQATSEYIKCKHWRYWKIKTTVLFMWPTSWSPDISSFYCSDINLLLIDYAKCKLCNKWLFLFENNSRSLTLEEKNCCSCYSRLGDRWKFEKYISPNVPSHLHIFWLNFDKANHSFLHPFLLGENRFSKYSAWSFEWGIGAWVKMHRFNAFSRNVNHIN